MRNLNDPGGESRTLRVAAYLEPDRCYGKLAGQDARETIPSEQDSRGRQCGGSHRPGDYPAVALADHPARPARWTDTRAPDARCLWDRVPPALTPEARSR